MTPFRAGMVLLFCPWRQGLRVMSSEANLAVERVCYGPLHVCHQDAYACSKYVAAQAINSNNSDCIGVWVRSSSRRKQGESQEV